MLKGLVKIANRLDSLGLQKEADVIDSFVYKISADRPGRTLKNKRSLIYSLPGVHHGYIIWKKETLDYLNKLAESGELTKEKLSNVILRESESLERLHKIRSGEEKYYHGFKSVEQIVETILFQEEFIAELKRDFEDLFGSPEEEAEEEEEFDFEKYM